MIEQRTGVWFVNEDVHSYAGRNNLVVEVERILPDASLIPRRISRTTKDMVVLSSPPSRGSFIKVLRWLILPP